MALAMFVLHCVYVRAILVLHLNSRVDCIPCLMVVCYVTVLARENWTLHKTLSRMVPRIAASIVPWKNGANIARGLQESHALSQ